MPINVLIVDDSKVMRAMISKSMGMSGLPIDEIYEAGDGREGLDILSGQRIDVAVVDMNMPVMDGEEMIDLMQEDPALKSIPVVVISTEGSEERIGRLREKGVEFIHKPFTPEKIRDTFWGMPGIGGGS